MVREFLLRCVIVVPLCLGTSILSAQEVRLEGGARDAATRVLRDILERDRFLLLARDTILPDDFRAPGDLIIVNADVRIEGEVKGAVAVIEGAFFIRPGARVEGPIAGIGGGIYPSGLAAVGDTVYVPLTYDIEVVERARAPGEGVRAAGERNFEVRISPPEPVYLVLPWPYGLRPPAYNRVDGLTLGWGPRLRIAGREDGPILAPWVTLRTARGEFGGGVNLDVPVGAGIHAIVRAASETRTHESWIRGDLANTLAALTFASDLRNYHHSESISLSLARPNDIPLIAGEFAISPRITYRASRDESLATRDPWVLFGDADDWRPNPPVEPGTVVSIIGGAELRWQGASTSFRGDASVERAWEGPGDFAFTRWSVEGGWTMEALWNHRISVFAKAFGVPGDEPAPPQRWSFIGGTGTLPTFDVAEFRGDHLVFIESTYRIPIPIFDLPILGPPALEAMHAIGTAWVTGTDAPPWEQNLGLGIHFPFLTVGLYVDPATEFAPAVNVGLSLPGF